MGMLGGGLGIEKVKDDEEGERFQIRYEDPVSECERVARQSHLSVERGKTRAG